MGNYKTKPPCGLKWTRSGNNLVFQWKFADNNYDWGQYIHRYLTTWKQVTTSVKKGKQVVKVTKGSSSSKHDQEWINEKLTSYTTQINPKLYYPYTKLYFTKISMCVNGRRAGFTENDVYYEPDWSTNKYVYLEILTPSVPQLSASFSSDYNNQTTFNWKAVDDNKSAHWFIDFERQTILVPNCNQADGSKISWSKAITYTGGATSQTITEGTNFQGYYSYTRWYRVRGRGPRGNSAWRYAKHVYAMPAYATITRAVVQNASVERGYTRIDLKWKADATVAHPIDKTTIEYLVTVPSASISTQTDAKGNKYRHVTLTPTSMSGATNVMAVKDTSGIDGQVITVPTKSELDHCVVVRVNTHHDRNVGTGATTYVTGSFSNLVAPTINSVGSLDKNTKRISISATNNSTVPNTHLVIIYKSSLAGSVEQNVGIIPPGQNSATVILPDSCLNASYTLAVQARLGDYSPVSPNTNSYTDYKLSNNIMASSKIWLSGVVPQPPSKVVLTSPKNGTIRVTWNKTWTDATGAELSWSNQEDAWESTNEPSIYVVNNTSASAWNISGLDVGKWYIRIRMFRETGDTKVYGAYSDIESITLASAPIVPALTLSDSVITETGSVTCYWAYVSGDGTAQQQAEICEATLNSDGTYTYGDVIAKTSSAQSLTLLAEDQEWKSGEIHYLAVRVMSASGEVSEGWSVPVSITIADKMNISIFSTSLVDKIETIGTGEEATEYNYKALTSMPLSVVVTSGGDPYIETEDITRNPDKTYYLQSSVYSLTTDTVWNMDKTYYSKDGDIYTVVTDPVEDPSAAGYYELVRHVYSIADVPVWDPSSYSLYELVDNEYILTSDTEWDEEKTYYSRSGTGNPGEYAVTTDTDWDPEKIYYKRSDSEPYTYSEIGQYALTDDTEWNPEKIYYSRSAEEPYEYTPVDQYFPTEDTEWDSEKTYYSRSEEEPYEYTEVEEPVENPKYAGLYEALTDPTEYFEFTSNPSNKEYYEFVNYDPYIYTVYEEPIENPFDLKYFEPIELDGLATLIIERAEPYHMLRPDESDFDGFEGETIAIINQNGSGEIKFDNSDLIGILDDGANYNLIVTITDTYGQTSTSEPVKFTVKWDHQAIIPSAEVELDADNIFVTITPATPVGYELTPDTAVELEKTYYIRSGEGTEESPYVYTEVVNPSGNPHDLGYYQLYDSSDDKCDIYRLSSDKPALLVRDAQFGTKYVDPYPTLKAFGGYRIAYRTINDDYITADNHLAFTDYNGSIDMFATIIDFDEDSIILPYDISINNSWSKDFTETKYLGGSIQGDWNPVVSRKGSVKSTTIVLEDPGTIKAMRRLADYAGICHVRTPDGSNFTANVEVTEDREEKWVSQLAKFSLSFTRVDPEDLDGVLYSSWISDNE